MNPMTMKSRKAVAEESIENWDDEDLDIGGDDLTFRSASLATTVTSHRRDSVSSRVSIRSDLDSNNGDEERQVHVPGTDERSTTDAIAIAARAGIPIPQNVPASALMGGTIKRLGGRKIKKIIQDDWDDGDLEFPGEGGFKMRRQDSSNFPDALRQVSGPNSAQGSPIRELRPAPKFNVNPRSEFKSKPTSNFLLDRFRDEEEDDFADEGATIKIPKSRNIPKLIPLVTPPTPQKTRYSDAEDDFEQDFQLPSNDEPLRLSARKDIPKTPVSLDDFGEWEEGGSLGTRHGGTKRDRNSNRSSSVTALSPSVSSSLTIESEDEGLDGLILPNGPILFDDILKRKQRARSPDQHCSKKQAAKCAEVKDDFLTGLEIGDGDVLDSKKLTLNRNIKVKTTRQTSPVRTKAAVSLTFINKPLSTSSTSRLPRPLGGHERMPSSLEPVSESGGPIMNHNLRRSQSRLGGHSSHSSVTSIVTPTTPSSAHSIPPPSTPRRRDLGSKQSMTGLRKEPTTTNAQLLKLKRSMPTIRSFVQSPALPPNAHRYDRPPSCSESARPNSICRPKTPVERGRPSAESQARKNLMPFLPAGALGSQSHHVMTKTSRNFRRNDSESSNNNSHEPQPNSRAVSRSTMRSPSPRRRGAEVLARGAAPKRQLTKPVRRRHFGEGFELDGFDDLPTSRDTEQRFVKEPIGCGIPKLSNLRNKFDHETPIPRTITPAPPLTPQSQAKFRDELPRFARDTNASRMARENTLAQRTSSGQAPPSVAITNQWKAKVAATTGLGIGHAPISKPKKNKAPQQPQLIKPLGNLNNSKSVKGMYYNPHTYRWEGNELDLSSFDASSSSPPNASVPSMVYKESQGAYRERETSTPRPALIQHVKSTHNVQVVGGMVFDPQRMCWLKMPSNRRGTSTGSGGTVEGIDSFEDEDEDIFKDVPDLEDNRPRESHSGVSTSDGLKEDFIVGEEFDVGPEFIKRQREEEERWKRKVETWIQKDMGIDRGDLEWRWLIRDMVMNHEI